MAKEPSSDRLERREEVRAELWRRVLAVPRPVVICAAFVVAIAVGLVIQHSADTSTTQEARPKAATSVYRNMTEDITIADQLPIDPQYSEFLFIVGAAGWTDRLNGKEHFTVFAPDTAAFSKIDPSALRALNNHPGDAARALVERHIVSGDVSYVQLLAGGVTSLTTVDGSVLEVKVDGAKVTVDGALVTKHDISARNGVIHVVDSVGEAPAG